MTVTARDDRTADRDRVLCGVCSRVIHAGDIHDRQSTTVSARTRADAERANERCACQCVDGAVLCVCRMLYLLYRVYVGGARDSAIRAGPRARID